MSLFSRPLSDTLTIVWRGDPALDRERLDAEHAEDKAAIEAGDTTVVLRPDFDDAYQRAYETQAWDPLVKPGEKATVFTFRLLVGVHGQRLRDMAHSGAVGPSEATGLAFRMGITAVLGWPPRFPPFARAHDKKMNTLGEMLTPECFLALCKATGNGCPEALGWLLLTRSSDPLPLS